MIKYFLASAFCMLLLVSCSSKKKNEYTEYDTTALVKDTNSFDILMGQFANNIENIWGFNEILIAGQKDYVKYTNFYKTRAHINFNDGVIVIESIADTIPPIHLRQAIINTLLMADSSGTIGLYTNTNDIFTSKEPFLYGQVLDQKNQPIRLEKHAKKFADYLLKTSLKSRINGLKVIYSVQINLVQNHLEKRAHKYITMVRKAARKYGVDMSLILAIMQTESSFNPYAMSQSNALGLMQVVQHSAGKDVFQVQGKTGIPSRNYLFDPQSNIDTGTAYLAMLNNIYLGCINNPVSRRYAVIAAYNSGVSSVLRIFSDNKAKAVKIINNLSPRDVYTILTTKHPSIESRRYLYRVNIAQKSYQHH